MKRSKTCCLNLWCFTDDQQRNSNVFFSGFTVQIKNSWLVFIVIHPQKKKIFLDTLKKLFSKLPKKLEDFCFSNFTKVAGKFFTVEKCLVWQKPKCGKR
jgi:hypothetical protein